MKQRLCKSDEQDLFFRIKTIIENGGSIVQVVQVGQNYIIIYLT